jgi:AhpD family alkylhydroperoxidase
MATKRAARTAGDAERRHARLDALLDDALKGTFPASDPVAIGFDGPDTTGGMERTMTEERLSYAKAAPGGFAAMRGLQAYLDGCGLEHSLMELVKMRASQINGCAYCLDMHSKDARAAGETEQRLYALPAWRETPFYSERERAALAYTEAVTQIASNHITDELYGELKRHFNDKEIADLTYCIVVINGWNRLAIPFRSKVGDYQPAKVRVKAVAAS